LATPGGVKSPRLRAFAGGEKETGIFLENFVISLLHLKNDWAI